MNKKEYVVYSATTKYIELFLMVVGLVVFLVAGCYWLSGILSVAILVAMFFLDAKMFIKVDSRGITLSLKDVHFYEWKEIEHIQFQVESRGMYQLLFVLKSKQTTVFDISSFRMSFLKHNMQKSIELHSGRDDIFRLSVVDWVFR